MPASQTRPIFVPYCTLSVRVRKRRCLSATIWALDIIPAVQVGLRTYWIMNRDAVLPPSGRLPDASGAWEDFLTWWG